MANDRIASDDLQEKGSEERKQSEKSRVDELMHRNDLHMDIYYLEIGRVGYWNVPYSGTDMSADLSAGIIS
jgi:hypothetical protein